MRLNGYRWISGGMKSGVISLRGGTFLAFCCLFIMLFCCCNLGGVGASCEIIFNLVSAWRGMGGVMLSRLGGAALMDGDVDSTVMGGVITLGKDWSTLGDEPVFCCGAVVGTCCCGWEVAR